MSFDLAVLAMDASADAEQARAMAARCWRSAAHAEGEVDDRIAAFYEALVTRFPPDSPDSSWMAALDLGIDHVIMNLSWAARSTSAIEAIQDLAAEHRLVLFDPQSETPTCPDSDTAASRGPRSPPQNFASDDRAAYPSAQLGLGIQKASPAPYSPALFTAYGSGWRAMYG